MYGTLALIALIVGISAAPLFSQCDHTAQFVTTPWKPKGAALTDTVPVERTTPSYQYGMRYDDDAITFFRVMDFRHNQERLFLRHWCFKKNNFTFSNEILADSSRTYPFTVATGDTVSLYRFLNWHNKLTQDQSEYFARHDLAWTTELVQASTGARLAMLDTLYIEREQTPSEPFIYTIHPNYHRIIYIVPKTYNGEEVFIRVRPYSYGENPYCFNRYDGISIGLSDYYELHGPDIPGQAFGKVTIPRNALPTTESLRITPIPSTGAVTVSVGASGVTALRVHDAAGRLIHHFNTGGRSEFQFTLSGGVYQAYAFEHDRIVATSAIHIAK